MQRGDDEFAIEMRAEEIIRVHGDLSA